MTTELLPRKNDDSDHSMKPRCSSLNVSPAHCLASSEKSKLSEFHCWFCQREKSFAYEGAASTILSSPAITLSMSASSRT